VALISCILFNFIKINSAFWNQLYLKTLISTVSFSIILAIYVWLSKKLFNENFRLTLKAWCCSLITQFSIAFAQIIIYYQIDQKIHILTYLWAVITTILTIILPITVGNFGLRESGMIFFSHYIDINPETAITGSIIMYLINLLVNISCSLTFLVAIKLKK
jgi:hypothetical protein